MRNDQVDYVGLCWRRKELVLEVSVMALCITLFAATGTFLASRVPFQECLVYMVGAFSFASFIAGIWITAALDLIKVHSKICKINNI